MNNGTAKDAFVEILRIWGSRETSTLADMEAQLDGEFLGFGTASHETFRTPEDLLGQLKREIAQVPSGLTFEYDWIEELELSDSITLINSKLRFTGVLHGKNFTSDLIRASVVLRRSNEKWVICHWHASAPDRSGDDEVFPGSTQPKLYEEVSVLFTDFVGFTNIASSIPARKLVGELNDLFSEFDARTARHGLEKIKTIGDAYMLVGGLKDPNTHHAAQCVEWAKEAIKFLKHRNELSGIKWDLRVGIHSGSAIGGIIGQEKKTFDLWGDTINIASRLEHLSEANRINVSAYTYELLRPTYECEYRGKIDIKGKGSIDMYFVK